MKKLILICLIVLMVFAGCNKIDRIGDADNDTSMFVLIEDGIYWKVVYHRETKVMYIVSDGSYNKGTFVVMVDADGKPLLYKEDQNESINHNNR